MLDPGFNLRVRNREQEPRASFNCASINILVRGATDMTNTLLVTCNKDMLTLVGSKSDAFFDAVQCQCTRTGHLKRPRSTGFLNMRRHVSHKWSLIHWRPGKGVDQTVRGANL